MKKMLVVVDMQNDFVDGSLGTSEAQAIVPAVVAKIRSYPPDCVWATRDTHPSNYLETQEGRNLPVPHCIKGTDGWQIVPAVAEALPAQTRIFDKGTFGSVELARSLVEIAKTQALEVEFCGLCTDICVISNALLTKAFLPEVRISVDPTCTAGVTPASHEAALVTMRSCQIQGA